MKTREGLFLGKPVRLTEITAAAEWKSQKADMNIKRKRVCVYRDKRRAKKEDNERDGEEQ